MSRASSLVACNDRPLCHVDKLLPSRVLLADGRSSISGDRCDDAVLRQSPGLCLSSIWFHSAGVVQGPPLQGSGGDFSGSVLAAQTVVSRSAGVASRSSLPPSYAEGSSQTAPLSSLSPEPPRASANWVSYLERAARHLGFSSQVAHQLAFCRRSSMQMNYQAK